MFRGEKRGVTRGFSSKAQVAMEYIIIVGFVVVITIPLVLLFYDYSGSSNMQINTNQINGVGKKIMDSAESVYYLGVPSKITLKANFPQSVSSVDIANNELVFKMSTPTGIVDIVLSSSVPIHGSLSNFAGVHIMQIEARSDGVWITE